MLEWMVEMINIKTKIRQALFSYGYSIDKLNSTRDLEMFLSRFREKYISCELVRIGGEGDGGYLHPNILNEISHCYSPGVSDVACFEKELSDKYKIKSYMADASVDRPPILDENFEFIPKFLGAHKRNEFITLSDWLSQTTESSKGNKILQMDIEGHEYDVLIYEDAETLASFSTMTIEFHFLHKLFETNFLKMFSAIFEKIYRNFSICHVHPNNCCGVAIKNGIEVPRVIEVTFLRNDLIEKLSNGDAIKLPNILDRKNIEKNKEIVMPKIWWSNDY